MQNFVKYCLLQGWVSLANLVAHLLATSIIFLLCGSRIKFRFMTGLVFISSLSFPLMDNLKNESLPNSLEWTAGILSVSLVSSVLGWILRLIVPHHSVPWLQNCFKRELVKDKIYIWKNNEFKKDSGKIRGWCDLTKKSKWGSQDYNVTDTSFRHRENSKYILWNTFLRLIYSIFSGPFWPNGPMGLRF